MAIGTAAAIGLGVAGIGSAVSASSNRRAANRAARASEQGTQQSLALQRESRDMAIQRLDPYNFRGNVAGNQINALLGLGGAPAPMQQPNAMSQFLPQNGGQGFNPAALGDMRGTAGLPYGLGDGFISTGTMDNGMATTTGNPMGQVPQMGQTPQQAAQNAFDIFRNSTGYQFRVNEGMDALNSGFAGSGLLQSGAALRALDDYRQGMASAEFGNYMGLLGQQQAVGAGAASAVAGVGQNFASNAGNLIMNNASNQANAAIARGQNNPLGNMLGIIGGGALGAFG